MKRTLQIVAIIAMLVAPRVWAGSGSVIVSAANLRDESGALAPTGSIAVLVVSTTGSGFPTFLLGSTPLTNGSQWGGGFYVAALWDLSSLNTTGQLLNMANIPYGNIGAGKLALYWFPTKDKSSTIVGNAHWGKYADPVGLDGSDPWVLPPEGGLAQLNFYTSSRGGANSDAAGIANNGILTPADLNQGSITDFNIQGTNVVVTFTTGPGVYNDLLATTNFPANSWSILLTNVVCSSCISNYIDVGAAVGPDRYYRLRKQ